MMGTRDGAIAWALAQFDSGAFRTRLADLVAIPTTSQEPEHALDVTRYLTDAIRPWLERLGFTVAIHPNPIPGEGAGPILLAERVEDRNRPTVLTYGHGDTVRRLPSGFHGIASTERLPLAAMSDGRNRFAVQFRDEHPRVEEALDLDHRRAGRQSTALPRSSLPGPPRQQPTGPPGARAHHEDALLP